MIKLRAAGLTVCLRNSGDKVSSWGKVYEVLLGSIYASLVALCTPVLGVLQGLCCDANICPRWSITLGRRKSTPLKRLTANLTYLTDVPFLRALIDLFYRGLHYYCKRNVFVKQATTG
jgi:hypothetical protein